MKEFVSWATWIPLRLDLDIFDHNFLSTIIAHLFHVFGQIIATENTTENSPNGGLGREISLCQEIQVDEIS